MSRFDPDPDKPYGSCETCGEAVADRPAMSAHFAATRATSGRSHTVRVTNRTRTERIEDALEELAESALYDFTESTSWLTNDGVTEEEITEAVRSVTADFADAWAHRDD